MSFLGIRPVKQGTSSNLQIVQFYRGIAVLLVVLFHGSEFISPRYHLVPLGDMFKTGFSGVFLFFVISGFIILTAHYRDGGRPRQIVYYLERRIIRIYPFYWLVLMVWGGWRVFTDKLGLHELSMNALLFEGTPSLIIPVSWTLRYEIIFYALFVSFILNRKLGMLAFIGWFALQWIQPPAVFRWLVDPMNLLFIFGLISARLYLKIRNWNDRYRNAVGAIALILGSVGFIATMYIYGHLDVDANAWPYHVVTIWGFGISSLLLMLATASRDINRHSGKLRFMNLIGDASYSIYLVHSPFGKLAWNLLRPLHPLWQGEPKVWMANLLLLWITLAAISAGIIIHLKIELPLLTLLRGKLTGR
jgi:peptidoglycan/LPS O-acetylase OafA/YrhL